MSFAKGIYRIFNNGNGKLIVLIQQGEDIRAYFLQELPDDIAETMRKNRMDVLSEAEQRAKNDVEYVMIRKEPHFRPLNRTAMYHLANKRGMKLADFGEFLTGCPIANKKDVTDDQIIAYMERNRPFETVEEMDRVMRDNWNAVVTDKDTVYVLGDFAFRGANWKEYADKLKGKKIFLNGNHDKFEEHVPDMLTVKGNSDRIVLFHYPIVEWDGFFRGTLHFYGHIHNSKNQAYELMSQVENAYNVGADLIGFTPRTKEQIIEIGRKV